MSGVYTSNRGRSQLWPDSPLQQKCCQIHRLSSRPWNSMRAQKPTETPRLGTPATPCQVKTDQHPPTVNCTVVPALCLTLIHSLLYACLPLPQVPSQACPTSLVSGGRVAVAAAVSTRRFPAAAWPPHRPLTRHCTAWADSNETSWTRAWTCCRNSWTGITGWKLTPAGSRAGFSLPGYHWLYPLVSAAMKRNWDFYPKLWGWLSLQLSAPSFNARFTGCFARIGCDSEQKVCVWGNFAAVKNPKHLHFGWVPGEPQKVE